MYHRPQSIYIVFTTDRYLKASSHHNPAQKVAVVNSLVHHRYYVVSDRDSWKDEKRFLHQVVGKNGYRKRDVDKAIFCETTYRNKAPKDHPRRKEYLPYVEGVTGKIGRLLRKHDFGFNTYFTTKSVLGTVKDEIHLKNNGVYVVPCSWRMSCISRTGSLVTTRIVELVRASRNRGG